MHAHTSPALFRRPLDDADLAQLAQEAGMRGFVLKDHDSLSTGRAYHVTKHFPGVDAFGAVVLNRSVGGIDPYVVESAIHYGAKVVWFPSNHAQWHEEYFSKVTDHPPGRTKPQLPGKGLSVLDRSGGLTDEAAQVLDIVADAGVCLASGHLSLNEIRVLLPEARRRGVEKILLTHVNWALCRLELEVQRELILSGAYLEYASVACVSPRYAEQDPEELAEWITDLGAERLILSSDLGQLASPSHPEGLGILSEKLLAAGVAREDLDRMLQYNPAVLLGLEE